MWFFWIKNKGELESLGINRVVDKLKRIAGINWGSQREGDHSDL